MSVFRLIFSNRRYLAPAVLFLSLNVLFATWAIYIPRITENLSLSESQLGFAVFFIALGTLCMVPFVPRIIKKFGLGKVVATAVISFCAVFIGPFIAPSYITLCFSLFLIGLASGLMDVSMNTLVTHIEKKDQVQFMSVSHAFFSIGGMFGAGLGSLLLPYLPSAFIHVSLVVAVMLLINVFFIRYYVKLDINKQEKKERFHFKHFKPLLGLAIISFVVMASEGAIADWSALYLDRVTLAATALFGLGYAVFNGTMALGRFFGDRISTLYGSRFILIGGCALAALGFGLVLLASTWFAIIGFGVVGLGLSVVVPELFRYCGNLDTITPVAGISFVSGSGFVGLLLGPVFMGFLAGKFSLEISFLALLCIISTAALISFSLKRN